MKTKLLLRTLAVFAAGLIGTVAASAAESLETSVKNLFKAVDAGDRPTSLAYCPAPGTRFPVVMFDYDWENKPVMIEGVEGVTKHVGSLIDEMAKRKIKVVSKLSNIRTDSRLPECGLAIFDSEQVITVDGKSEKAKFHVTMLASYEKKTDKWRMVHWHATLVSAEPAAAN